MTHYVDASGANVQRCDRCGNRMPLWGCDRDGNSICDACERAARAADGCTEHSFGSNDGQPVDDHCCRCGIPWSERERAMCLCGSGLPRYEGACPACYPSVQRATAASARYARVISGTGDSGEQRELAALVRGLRGN
jgi:hypothetical protein